MPADKKRPDRKGNERPISLAPLGFEEALEAILQTGPHPKDEDKPNEPDQETKDNKKGRK